MKREILDRLLDVRARKVPAALVTALDDDGRQVLYADGTIYGETALPDSVAGSLDHIIRLDRSRTLTAGEKRYFIQVFNPPLRLIVVGAVHIAQALVPMASMAGYAVTVVDPRRAFATDARFPETALHTDWPDEAMEALGPDSRTAVVTLTHDPKLDDPALEAALASSAFYIAALGSSRTHAARLDRLRDRGISDDSLNRIHGPAGLALGAVSPAEIAISVMAQMTAILRKGADSA